MLISLQVKNFQGNIVSCPVPAYCHLYQKRHRENKTGEMMTVSKSLLLMKCVLESKILVDLHFTNAENLSNSPIY